MTVTLLAVTLSTIHNNTLVHPYLLADNRHYTFYLWNRLYARHFYFRYLMAPVYLFGGHLVWNVCFQKRSTVFRLIYAACLALSVVPQRLLEPRYFILPFIIARMQRSPCYEEPALAEENRATGGRASGRRGGGRSSLRALVSNFFNCCLKSLRVKCKKVFNGFPLAHICWEFLYYLIINLATLAVFGSKTFWWKDFAEPQRIMW